MKQTILFVIALLCGCVASGDTHAQLESAKRGDARVTRALNQTDLQYTVDKDGDFRVSFDVGSGRSQMALVFSATEQLRNLEIREVRSAAMVSKSPLSSAVANRLLQENFRNKLALWGVQKSGSSYIVVCIIRVAADSDGETLETALRLAGQQADDMEKVLTGKDDY